MPSSETNEAIQSVDSSKLASTFRANKVSSVRNRLPNQRDLPWIEMEQPKARPTIEKIGVLVPKQHIAGLQESEVEIGEEKYRIVNNVTCEHNLRGVPSLQGTVTVTNFKIIFKADNQQPHVTSDAQLHLIGKSRVQDFFRLPLGMLAQAEVRTFVVDDNRIKHSCVELVSKDQRRLSIIMSSFEDCNSLKEMIRHVTFLENIAPAERQMNNFFAVQMYEHIINKMALMTPQTSAFEESALTRTIKLLELNQKVWHTYSSPIKEFLRQGCSFYQQNANVALPRNRQALFQTYDNSSFSLCQTYPAKLVFPAQTELATVEDSAKFRSSNRLPVLTYFDRVTTASIWRCSQPCTFLFGSRNRGDEDLLRQIGLCNSTLLNKNGSVEIFDARPLLNARTNKLKGGGYEDCGPSAAYSNCRITFGDIDNIHVVRESFEKVFDMAYTATATDKSAS